MKTPWEFLQYSRNKIKNTWKIAFVSAFVIGLLIHLPVMLSDIPNHDGLSHADRRVGVNRVVAAIVRDLMAQLLRQRRQILLQRRRIRITSKDQLHSLRLLTAKAP